MSVGSFVVMGLKGDSLTSDERKIIEKENIGGVILFKRNCTSYLSLKNLIKELKSLKTSSPLIISVDREGGSVDRLKHLKEFCSWPSPSEIAFLSLNEIKQTSFHLHHELRHIGINVNWSPCVDVPVKPSELLSTRVFSKNPSQVGNMGIAVVHGARQAQVLTCGKHFPGHGGTSKDSHFELPTDTRNKNQILSDAVFPFRFLISSKVPLVMLAHILYPSLDDKNIAPLSSNIIQSLLKDQLGFKGLVVSDDLEMEAVKKDINKDWIKKSLEAGVHLFLSCQNLEFTQNVLDLLKQNQSLSCVEGRLKEIENFKKWYLIDQSTPTFHSERDMWFEYIQKKLSGRAS